MTKIIYETTTGSIKAICSQRQDHERIMNNYSNVDFIDSDQLPPEGEWFYWQVNLETLTLEKKSL